MNNARLRLLFSSNIYKCASGYGTQAASLLPRLAELPEFGGRPGSMEGRKNIAQFAWYGLHGTKLNLDGFDIYPGIADPYGNDAIGPHTKDFGANLVVTLIDVWVLHKTAESIAPALFLPWFPIDSDPVPGRVIDSLANAFQPLTYSRWGYEMLRKMGINNTYVPHGVETDLFKVLPNRDAVAAAKRKLTGVDGAHLTMGVWANKGWPNRKNPDGQLAAWAKFAKDKPHARFYLHTDPTPAQGGPNLLALVADLGIAEKVIFPNRYQYAMGFPADHLATAYNAADVYMGATMSEGFGIPIIEAQAAGCPVIVTDFSSMPELVRWGTSIPIAHRIWTPMETWQVFPDEQRMTDALEAYHAEWLDNGREMPMAKRHETSAKIHQEYSWDSIVKYHWAPLITKLAAVAPPLDARFQVPGVTFAQPQPTTSKGEVQDFADMLNDEIAKAAPSKPQRRVAPLVPRKPISQADEVADAINAHNRGEGVAVAQ